MKVTPDISKRFHFASGLSMLMVVFIHARFIHSRWAEAVDVSTTIGKLSYALQFLLSENIFRLAVPLFFLISGFWLSYGNDGSVSSYFDKLKKRCWTLLVPYFLICGLWLTLYVIGGRTHITSIDDLLNLWLIKPVPFQFWFLQYLMLITICSISIICLVRKLPLITISVLLALYLVDGKTWGGLSEAFLYYTIGIGLANYRLPKFNMPTLLLLAVVYIVLLIYILAHGEYVFNDDVNHYLIVYKLDILVGVALVIQWIFFSKITDRLFLIPSGLSFFIFAFHEPLQSICKII